MSDDEFYDDEYADFHDMLYDADPDPDLADDLAEHAAHSPVWFDNPNEEAREYFSDWEYYSDDYFDDDPALLGMVKNTPGDNQQQSQRKQLQSARRGRKRKLSEAREPVVVDTNEIRALKACIRGTVWKTGSPEPAQIYKGETAKPVALRLSKAIMRSAYNTKQGFGRARLTRDESWANELSLADMGLRTETSVDLQPGFEPAQDEEEADGIYIDEDAASEEGEEDEMDIGEETELQAREPDKYESAAGVSIEKLVHSQRAPGKSTHHAHVDDSDGEAQIPRKKRKIFRSGSSTDTKDTPNTPETSYSSNTSVIDVVREPEEPEKPAKRLRGRPKKQPVASEEVKVLTEHTDDPAPLTRKRKISSIESSATASTASTRAKRIATTNSVSTSEAKKLVDKVDSQPTRKLRGSTLRSGRSKT